MFISEIPHTIKWLLPVCYCFKITQPFNHTNSYKEEDIHVYLFCSNFLSYVEVRKSLGFS